MNDSAGNTNYSTILFNITDDVNPKINITFPLQNNTNHSDNTIDINYTRSQILNLDNRCWYSQMILMMLILPWLVVQI